MALRADHTAWHSSQRLAFWRARSARTSAPTIGAVVRALCAAGAGRLVDAWLHRCVSWWCYARIGATRQRALAALRAPPPVGPTGRSDARVTAGLIRGCNGRPYPQLDGAIVHSAYARRFSALPASGGADVATLPEGHGPLPGGQAQRNAAATRDSAVGERESGAACRAAETHGWAAAYLARRACVLPPTDRLRDFGAHWKCEGAPFRVQWFAVNRSKPVWFWCGFCC